MRDRMWRTLGIVVFILFFCVANVYASEKVVVPISKTTNSVKDFSARAFFKLSPIVAGEAIDGGSFFNTSEIGSFKSRDYDDIFDPGYGGGLEVAYRHNNWVSGVFGVAYEHFDGESFSAGKFMFPLGMPLPARAEVEDWDVVSIYAGAKLHLTGKKAEKGWDPYCRFDIGGIYLSDSAFGRRQYATEVRRSAYSSALRVPAATGRVGRARTSSHCRQVSSPGMSAPEMQPRNLFIS